MTNRPLYYRLLRLHHIRPRGSVTFAFFEGSIGVAALLTLADIINWWGLLAIPVTVAVMVKLNDIVAGTDSESLALGPLAAPSLAGGVVTGRSAVPRPDRPRTADQDVPAEPDGPYPSATARGRASSVARGVAVVPPADPPVGQQPTRSRLRPAARQSEPRFGPASDGAELGNVSPGPDPGCRRTRGNQRRFG
jgi:hypothetical protein